MDKSEIFNLFQHTDIDIQNFVESYQEIVKIGSKFNQGYWVNVSDIGTLIDFRTELSAQKTFISNLTGTFKVKVNEAIAKRKIEYSSKNVEFLEKKMAIGKAKAKAEVYGNVFLPSENLYESLYHKGKLQINSVDTLLQVIRDKESFIKLEWDNSKKY